MNGQENHPLAYRLSTTNLWLFIQLNIIFPPVVFFMETDFYPMLNLLIIVRFYNEALHSWYRSHNIVRVIKSRILRWTGHVARIAFNNLTGKPKRKRSLRRPRHRWILKKIGINTRKSVHSVEDRDYWRALVNTAFNLRFP